MSQQQVLINGEWRNANSGESFSPMNPSTGETLSGQYPVSEWSDIDAALSAAEHAFVQAETISAEKIAKFLRSYADKIEQNRAQICEIANLETGLAVAPRFNDVELPRTTNQLRQAAEACLDGSWKHPVIDSQNNVRSIREAIGPVVVIGPNNFPLAFGSISGGDFAAAIAAGNPVIAKAHPLHPGTTTLFAKLANEAVKEAGLPTAMVQLIFHCSNEDGLKWVADQRVGAVAFTGSRKAGLALKQAADAAGTPIYLEMSSLNPVVVLSDALASRGESIANELSDSCILAAGQLCTKPGIVFVPETEITDQWLAALAESFSTKPAMTLLDQYSSARLNDAKNALLDSGAKLLSNESDTENESRFCAPNRLFSVAGDLFMEKNAEFEKEMFGNATLLVIYRDLQQLLQIIPKLDGQLTGCIYAEQGGTDADNYASVESVLRRKVGRLINDKMPTGVLVSPAMNHGGPFPATGHPGFTAVGIPASMQRFSLLRCYDNVDDARLPEALKSECKQSGLWRQLDGQWQQC